MCGISGFFDSSANFLSQQKEFENVLTNMTRQLYHRGPDDQAVFLDERCGLAHTRLSIIDLDLGRQPMHTRNLTIVYNGELYNSHELRKDIMTHGISFQTNCDTEVILNGYLFYGSSFFERLNGIFSFAIYNKAHSSLILCRDSFGVKPLFYTFVNDTLVFSSELKGLMEFPGFEPVLDSNGLNEVFGLGPARTPGSGVLKGVYECKPGHYITYQKKRMQTVCYFRLTTRPHTDSYEDTIENVKNMVHKSITTQMVSDVPICTFLSGGLDSSVVSSICAKEMEKSGKQLSTFSFDFVDNDKYFTPNSFQPSQDRPFVEEVVSYLHLDHHYLYCNTTSQADLLYESVKAHDLPCMADIDSSLLFFCREVAKDFKVVLTGECADEVFGGYPWFHREAFLNSNTFPWTPDLEPRKQLLSKDLLSVLHMEEYVEDTYLTSIGEVDLLPMDNETEINRRRISYLNLRYFMQTLLNRMDRTSMHSGLEARVPFADKELVQYVFNVPWEMKAKNGLVKNLLRTSSVGLLPDSILFRKKSPYPKTYNPAYESLLTMRLKETLADCNCPLHMLLDESAITTFLNHPKDYGKPWYGQLMAGPQMIAYLLQISYWLDHYHIKIQ